MTPDDIKLDGMPMDRVRMDSILLALPTDVTESTGLLLAYSGGLDSTVLLHLLASAPAMRERGLRAIHVHHGLHSGADAWAQHCAKVCAEHGVALEVVRVVVDAASGDGPEAAARRARHSAFAGALGKNEALVLAHHSDDQAETLLLRALRASGPDGLAAMRAWRTFGRGFLWRPLLGVTRARLLTYAQGHGLRWVEDPSNQEADPDRNFLRHRVLPVIRERWPHASRALARSAALCEEASALLAIEDADALAAVAGRSPAALDVCGLHQLPKARRARVLRRWIADAGLPPLPAQGLQRLESDLLPARADAQPEFAWDTAVIHRWRDQLFAERRQAPLPADWERPWDGSGALLLPAGGSLVLNGAPGFASPLRVHARRGGERIRLAGRNHSHALKHVLQERNVPPWQRARMPLLCDGETVLAAGDLVYSTSFDAWLQQRNACLSWIQPL